MRTRSLVLLIASLASLAQVSSRPAPPILLVSMVVTCGAPNAGSPWNGTGHLGKVCLDRRPALRETDVRSARLERGVGKKPLVVLSLKDDAARRFREITGMNMLSRIGVVVNGKLDSVTTIQEPGAEVPIQGDLTESQAEALMNEFNRISRKP